MPHVLLNKTFTQNLNAIFRVDQPLSVMLRQISKLVKFKNEGKKLIFLPENELVYEDFEAHFKEKKEYFDQNFAKYPVMFFYGLGNGILLKYLLENKKHKRIIVFESELELFYLALQELDFSKDIEQERLILFYTPNLNPAQFQTLFAYPDIETSLKTYNFHIQCEFYEKHYKNEIEKIHQELIEQIKFSFLKRGNDPLDSIIGIKNILINLPKMLRHGIFKAFLKQRFKQVKNAIIVSTGPSLSKQLPLLKEYANKASIMCADSAYPILAKNGIKPDFVFMLERTDFTAEFFNNDFKEFDDGILFILTSVVDKNATKYLEKNNRNYMIVSRPLLFAVSLGLDEFGYLGVGHSVANMAYELAAALRHENIIFIGQDLAYADDGSSHPKDYQHGAEFESDQRRDLYTLAYGQKGQVRTQITWNLFRHALESDITLSKLKLGINTYNATEGGAHIKGSIERPFKELCETLLKENVQKPFAMPPRYDENKAKALLKQSKEDLQAKVKKADDFLEEIKKELELLQSLLPRDYVFEKLDFEALKKSKERLLKLIQVLKQKVIFTETLHAVYFHNECELVRLESVMSKNEHEEKELLILFLETQGRFFIELGEYIYTQNNAILECIKEYTI
ncbi:motility accessory factor [Campylobacter sp. MIT 12-5580]|uniref:motility associated factor glycosyltransferase family protein n=1 Tax=Campylobacter sp. MIT 12-5580 TaxID=2040651 RepID=UPI0010F82C4A|nr:motility associated factor glycosyltransferase family protein [Campylobacter sp. MIT 12-5580]TKX30181.1 motility accessory factor [Campylobacter sp. MIT 12-5580]